MALWVCSGVAGCGTKYAVGLFRCPRCHNTEFHEDGDPMAKITRHGGASDKTLPTEDAAAAETDSAPEVAADQAEPAAERVEINLGDGEGWRDVTEDVAGAPTPVADEGGEESSRGSSSSASTEPQPTSFEPSSKQTPKRARTTASRSKPGRTGSSSAPSTDGGQTEATSAADTSDE